MIINDDSVPSRERGNILASLVFECIKVVKQHSGVLRHSHGAAMHPFSGPCTLVLNHLCYVRSALSK